MIKVICASIIVFFVTAASAQTVSTLVPFNNFMGDGIIVAPSGDLFVASGGGRSTVMKVTSAGEVSQFAAGFRYSVGIALDAAGNFYVNSYDTGQLHRITPSGEVSVWIEGLDGPAGIAIDESGAIFVSEFGANFSANGRSVSRITSGGEKEKYLTGSGLRNPIGIAFDEAGTLYMSNWDDGNIYRSREGAAPELFVHIDGADINQIAYSDGYLYVPSPNLRKIFRVSLDGAIEHFAGSGESGREDGPALEASFSQPNGIAATADGQILYVVEGDVGAIRKIELGKKSTAVEDSSWGGLKVK